MRTALILFAVLTVIFHGQGQIYGEISEEELDGEVTFESAGSVIVLNSTEEDIGESAVESTSVSDFAELIGGCTLTVNGCEAAENVPLYSVKQGLCVMVPIVKTLDALGARIMRLDEVTVFAAYENRQFVIDTAKPSVTEYKDGGRYTVSWLWVAPGGYIHTEQADGDVFINDGSLMLLMETLNCRIRSDVGARAVCVERMY